MSLIERPVIALPELRPDADLEALFEEARQHQRRRRAWLGWTAAGLIVLGLAVYAFRAADARPSGTATAGGARGLVAAVRPQAVVIAIDVSGSMAATDLQPTRLAAAVSGLERFVARLPADVEVGLISFSTSASPVVAPTRDRAKLRAALSALSVGGGTALGTGLAAATTSVVSALERSGLDHKRHGLVPGVVVLLSDGGQNRGPTMPLAAAGRARAAGIRVYAIALGARNGSVPFGFGQSATRVPVPPDPSVVRAIVAVSGGEALDAASAAALDADLLRVARALSR